MKIEEIKKICIDGSQAYYDYLSNKRNGGVSLVPVTKISKINDSTYKIKVPQKLFEIDSICFKYNGDISRTYTAEDIKVKVYDNNKRTVIIKVNASVQTYISKLNHSHWNVVIDLKFLIKRVIDWYEDNGNSLKLENRTLNNIHFDSSVIFPEQNFKPSQEQRAAIEMIHSNSLSYVWGAPGTGKTRFVLSYSILSYIKQEKKVLVLAPTNVALEQVLSGVIEMTDKKGISRNKILRLGFPSQHFANQYGEICEVQGIEKELKRVRTQIKILTSILGLESDKEKSIYQKIEFLSKLIKYTINKNELDQALNSHEAELRGFNNEIRFIKSKLASIDIEQQSIYSKKNSLAGKVLGFLSSKVNYDKEINKLINDRHSLQDQLKIIASKTSDSNLVIKSLKSQGRELDNEISLYNSFLSDVGLRDSSSISDLEKSLQSQKEELAKELENHQVYKSLSKEYDNLSQDQLSRLLLEYKIEEERLNNYSIESRIENSLVIGATLDTFIHRYKNKTPRFSHIFIDEAGYASIVKALTVFTSSTPVTLLGDHLQLPPVCEISKLDIQGNSDKKMVFPWDQSAIFLGDFWFANSVDQALAIYLRQSVPSQKFMPLSALTRSFRFGPNLANVLDKYVYSAGFKSQISTNTKIIVCNISNPSTARNGTRLNQSEAIAIQRFVMEKYQVSDSVSILAPYRAQIDLLKKLLPAFKDEDKILTVHKSQGREWDTVLYSVCDIGNGKSPWFTDSTSLISNGLNNVNTAVSRAKKELVIFCSINEWSSKEGQLICGLIGAATHTITIDSSQFTFSGEYKSGHGSYSNPNPPEKDSYKGKSYTPILPDEEWESKTLFWSNLEKPGYTFSSKKQAWWKHK